ncbi:hypothetical protein WCN91_04310 [Pseudoalteromonas sp. YIC-827]|uniref:Uncharacterized protein n=1 Tax=Pseudoalteromonas qingdaonensis TaxID=3131913 RepID=A0ABU9MTN0_9GAMM
MAGKATTQIPPPVLFEDEFHHPIPKVEAPKSTKDEKDFSAYP